MASREPQRPEIDANRRREPLKRINLSGQLALMGETRRFRPFFRKLLIVVKHFPLELRLIHHDSHIAVQCREMAGPAPA